MSERGALFDLLLLVSDGELETDFGTVTARSKQPSKKPGAIIVVVGGRGAYPLSVATTH